MGSSDVNMLSTLPNTALDISPSDTLQPEPQVGVLDGIIKDEKVLDLSEQTISQSVDDDHKGFSFWMIMVSLLLTTLLAAIDFVSFNYPLYIGCSTDLVTS